MNNGYQIKTIKRTFELLHCIYGGKLKIYNNDDYLYESDYIHDDDDYAYHYYKVNAFSIMTDSGPINFCYNNYLNKLNIGRVSTHYEFKKDKYNRPNEFMYCGQPFRGQGHLISKINNIFDAYIGNLYGESKKWEFNRENHPIYLVDDFFLINQIVPYNPKSYPLSRIAKISNVNEMLWNTIKQNMFDKYILVNYLSYCDIAKQITQIIYLLTVDF